MPSGHFDAKGGIGFDLKLVWTAAFLVRAVACESGDLPRILAVSGAVLLAICAYAGAGVMGAFLGLACHNVNLLTNFVLIDLMPILMLPGKVECAKNLESIWGTPNATSQGSSEAPGLQAVDPGHLTGRLYYFEFETGERFGERALNERFAQQAAHPESGICPYQTREGGCPQISGARATGDLTVTRRDSGAGSALHSWDDGASLLE